MLMTNSLSGFSLTMEIGHQIAGKDKEKVCDNRKKYTFVPQFGFGLGRAIPTILNQSTVLHFPLAALDDLLMQELKQQYGTADVSFHLPAPPAGWLDEAGFWQIIGLLDWDQSGNDDAVLAPAVAALAAMPIVAIHQFEDLLAEKLWHLDTPAHAKASLANQPHTHLSVDGFLYDRCCVVANGKAFYEAVLDNPAKMPAGYSFEHLLSLANRAYRAKTGKDFTHISQRSYETYSNEAAWEQ